MASGGNLIDRLLPRHDSETGLELAWNVRMERSGFRKKEEVFSHSTILDLSLEGALVEVPDSQYHEIGSKIAVRFRGIEGHADICHRRTGRDGHLLYGVQFTRSGTFGTTIDDAVGEIRGDSAALNLAWNRQN